jgi:hypothetical protein
MRIKNRKNEEERNAYAPEPENDRFENDDFTSEEALTDRIGVLSTLF